MTDQITKDSAYNAVAPDDFGAMIEVDRYGQRSGAFNKIISATHDHFWDPLDKRYLDLSAPFDLKTQTILPQEMIMELQTPLADNWDAQTKIDLTNGIGHMFLSNILHGEQAALSLSASLVHILLDQGAAEYAANQAREEARHVTAFAMYIDSRWGKPAPCTPVLGNLLTEMVSSELVYKKIVGMQMLVEGLAMGAFATIYNHSNDPMLRQMTQLVMTDEAFHHKFGKIWADKTMPHLSDAEHNTVEDWAQQVFQTLLFNMFGPGEKAALYASLGIDVDEVKEALASAFTDDARRARMRSSTNIMRVLCKTLVKAGIITDRTKSFYATFVDMDELAAEGDEMVGDPIAEDGIRFLQMINGGEGRTPSSTLAAE